MKKLFGIAVAAAVVLMACLFTGCAQDAGYSGRYWVAEYVTDVPNTDYETNYYGKSDDIKSSWRNTWPTAYSSSYEKKNNLTTPELSAYMKSKMDITDSEINEDLADIGTTGGGMYYIISYGSPASSYDFLYITDVK